MSTSETTDIISEKYRKVKKSYRSDNKANVYDSKRFNTPKGRLLNRRYLTAVTGVLNNIKERGYQIDLLLDMPCGTGRVFQTLSSKGINFMGADISKEMMLVSQQKIPSDNVIPLIQCDGEKMPFKDNSFDVITCFRFLTMKVPAEARHLIFKEMARISRSWVIIECTHKTYWTGLWYWLAQKLLHIFPKINYFTRKTIKKELNDAGIEIVRTFCPFGLFSNKWLLLCRIEGK